MVWGLNGPSNLGISWVGPLLERVEFWLLAVFTLSALIALLFVLLRFTLWILKLAVTLRQPSSLLEITPPSGSMTQSLATSEFFTVLHGLSGTKSWIRQVFGALQSYSLEIVSSKQKGIRYLLRIAREDAATVEQMLFSYLPDVKIALSDNDYLADGSSRLLEFRQTGHFAFPIGSKEELMSHDPIAYIAGSMANLNEDEVMVLQYVVRPTVDKRALRLKSQLLVNGDVLQSMGGQRRQRQIGKKIGWMAADAMGSVMDGIGEIVTPTFSKPGSQNGISNQARQVELGLRPERVLSASEQQLVSGIENKIRQPLYRVSIRGYVSGGSAVSRKQRISGLKTALSSFDVPGYQSIRAVAGTVPAFLRYAFYHRLPSIGKRLSLVLSSNELAALYHFPYSGTSRVDNVVSSLSKTLPAPVSLKNNPHLDVVLGVNVHHGVSTPIGLTSAERERHMYIVGGTGNGKTTMLEYQIIQDMQNGKGVAVIDPHGDLAEDLLNYVPEERIKDVIYFNPDDLGFPIGMNILELDRTLEGDDLAREKDRITESVVSMFRKIFSDDDSGGHRIEYVIRNAVQTALTIEDATLFTIYALLNDPPYRRKIVKTLANENLKKFWKTEYGSAGDYQKVKMSGGITAKIGRFLFSVAAKRVLEQPKSTIDFLDIMDSGKILICNFSKGLIGEDTSELFGITVLAKLQLASLKRISQRREVRRPYYVYVDEFQNFATKSFVQILSEARKFGLFITMAQQSTSQQDDPQMVNTILANVGTVIAFRTANSADEKVLFPFFAPALALHELANLASYNYYVRISAVNPQEPFTGLTMITDRQANSDVSQKIVKSSRNLYAIDYSVMQRHVLMTKQNPTRSTIKKTQNKKSLIVTSTVK